MNPGGVGSPYGGNGMLAAGDRVGVKSSPHVVAECSGGLLPQNITTTTITTTTTTTTSSSTTSVREVQPNQAYLSGESSLGRSNLASHLQLNGLLLSQFGLYNRVVEVPHTSSKDVIAPHLLPSPILNVGEGKEQQQQLSPVPCGSGAAVVPPPGSSTHFTSTTSGSTHITNPTSDSSLNFTKPSPGSSSMCFTNPTSGSSHFSTTSDLSTQFTNPTNSLPNVCGKRYDQLTVVTSVHTEVTRNLSGISMCGEKERVTGSADAGPLQSPVAGVSGASSGTYPARNAVFPSPNSVKTLKDHCDNPKEVIGASVEPCGKSYASEDVPVQLKSDKNVEKSADDRTGSIKSVDCPQKVMSCATPVQEVDSDGSRLHLSGDCESKAEGSGHSSDGIESKNKDAQSEVLNTFCLKGQNSPKEVTTSVRGEPASVGNVMNRQSDASTSEKKVRNESADEKNVQVPTERCTAQSPAESGYEGRSSIEPTDSETRDSDIEVVFEKSGMSETGNEHPKPAQEISGSKFKNGDGDKGSSRFSKSGKNIEEIDLSKGDSDSNPSASFLNTDSGLVQYLEPISDDENSLLCAPCPSSGLSSVSGVQSSSNTPMFSDTPSDTSHGTLMVKISDAVAAILSDVSDDSLPCSPIASNSNSVDGFNSALQREKLSEKIDSICEKLDRDCAKDGNSKILSGPQSDCPQNSDKPAEKSCTKGEIVSTSDASISKGFIEDMKKDDSCLTSQTLPHVSIQIGNKQTSVGIAESCKPPSEQTQVHSGNKKSDVSEGKLSDSVCQPVTRTKPDDEPASEVISVALELLHNKDKEMASVCTRKSENTTSVTNESHSSETSSATLNLSSSLPAVAPELPPHLHLGNDSISSFCQMSKTATDNHSCQNLTSGSQTLSSHVGNSNTPQSEREDKAAHMLTYSTPKLIQDIPSVIMQESEPFIDNWVEPNTQVQSVLQEGESQVAGEKPSSDASSGFKVGHTPDANTDVPRSDTVKHAGTVDMIDPPNDKTRIEIPASLEVMKPDHSIYTSETEDHKTNRNFGSLTCELTDTENKVTRQGKSDDWSSNKCTMTLLKLDQSTERDTSIDSSSTLSECAMESVNRCVSDNSIIISDEISTNAAITTVEIEGPTSESCSPVKDHFMKKGEHTTPVPYDLTEISDPISGMSLRPKPGELCGDITRDERENAQVPHHENLSLLPVSDSRESSSFASCLSPVAEILTQCDISSMYTKSVEEEVTVQHCTTSDNAFLPNTSTSLDTHSTLVDHSDQHDVVNSQSLCDQLPQPSVENTRKQSFETNVSDSVNTSVDPECPGVNLNPDDQELKSESVKIEVKTPVSEAVTPTIEVKLATSEIETLATEVNTTTTKILSAINEGDTLASEIKTPGTNVENLASEIKSLTSEVEASSTEIGTSVAEVETLTAEIDKVTAEIQTPVNITGMPNNEVDTITEDEAPPTEVHTLVTNTEMSITEAEIPANEGKASTTKGQMVDDQAIEPKSSGENELQFPHHDASESYQSQPGSEEVTSTSVENVQPTLSLDVCGQSESHQDLECSELADTGTNSNVNNMSDICHIGTNNSATVESEPLESVTFRSCGMSAHNSEVDQVSAVDVNVSASPVVAPGISDLSADTTQVCSTISVDQEPKEEDNSISSQITVAETVATPSNRGTDKLSEMEILMTDSIAQQENISGEPIQCIDNAAPGLVEHTVNKESETSGKPVFGSKQQLAGNETWENSSLEGKSTSCDAPDKEETIPVVANSLPKTKVFITSSVSPDECRNNVIDPSPVVSLEPKQDNTFSTTPDEGVHSLVKEIDTDTSDGGCMEMNPGTDSGASTQINTETNSDVSEEIRTEIISGPCEEITAKTDPQAHEEMPIITETASGTCEEINIKTDSRDCMDKITETYSEAYAGINTETTDSGTCAEINTPGIEVKECVDPLPSQVTDSMLQDPIMNVEQRNRCLTSEFSLTVADIEECTGEEAASLTSKTAQITDFETKSPKETLPSPTCVNGEDGMTKRKCKDCNADVAPEDMIPHLDLHKSEIESKQNEQNTSSTVVTRSGEEKLKLSWNIYDNSLNYLDGKDFCLSTAKKVDDPNFDRNYLKLPLRNDVDDAVVPEEAKLDPGKDISKYLKDKKAVKLPLADNDEIQRQFSFAMQMALLKRMTKKGRRSASSGNSYSRSRKEDDLFTVLGISVQKSRNSFKKDNVDNSGTTPSRKCKAKSVFENVGEAGTPVLTRTRSGMVTTKGDPEDKPKEVRLRPTEVTSVVDGEWAKEHTYICCSCGAGYLHLADIMDHKWEMHPSVWCAHTMIQGQGVVPLSFCRQYQPPIARPHVLPLPEIPALDSPTTSTPDPTIRERTCTSCHAVFNSESSFHAHLVECGGLSLLSAMKKKSKKGFRFKRRKGQGVPNNRYDNTSQPSTPLKAKNGDRSSGLNTPLNDRSAASAVHTCGVKRRLELAVGSIDNVELKNRLKAIIIGSRGSSGRAVSSSRRFVKMKLRKKVLENRKLRKTRQSDRVKEIASKEQQQAQEKKDEKKGDAKDEKHESIETQTVPNSEEGKETTENVIGKDHPDIPVPKSLKSKSNNKDAKTKKLKKSKKKIDTLKDPGSTEAAVKDMNQTPDTKINILESKEKKTKDTSRKNALQAEKKVKGVKKMNGVIDKGKKASKKTLNTTGQVNKKAVNAIPAEVSVTSENGGSSIPVKKAVSKSHKAVQTVEVEGFKNLVTLGGKKGKAKKSKTVKMVMPKPAMDSKKQSLSTTKSATKHNASAKKGKVNSKQSTGEKGKLAKNEKIKPSTSKKVKEETKNNDSTPKSLASEGGLGELIHEKEGESDVQQDQEQLQMSKGTTQTKGRKGKDTGSLNPKDNSVELSVAPTTTTTTTKKEPEQKEEEQYISFSEESEEEESEEDYEPEVIHNFRSGRRCGGRLGLRHKRKLINTRYSFRTCYSTKEKDDGEGKGGVDSKVTTEINKRKVNYTEKDDDEGLTEEPLTAKRKRKIANYENQDDYTYVPNESSSDLEDEDDLSDKETSSNQESSTRVAGNRVKTRRLSSAERSVTEDIPVGTLRKSKSCDTSSDSKQEEQIKNTLQDTSSDIKEGEEVKPSLPVGDINVTTGTSTVANTLLSEVKADNEVKISTAIVMKSTEDISNSNSMEQIKTKQDAKKARPAKGKTKINPQTERTVDDQDITPLQKKARVMTLLGRLALNSVFQAQVDEVTGKLQRKRRSVRNPEDLISETEDEMENIAAENTSDPSNAPGVTMEEVKVTEAIESSVEQLGVEEKHAVESVETTHGSCSDNEEPKGEKTSTQNKMPCNEIQDVPIQNIDESVDSYSKDVLQRDELALEVCSKEETQTKQKLKPGKNEAHTKYESEAGVSEKSIDATDMKQEILFSKKRNRGRKKVAVIEGKNNTVDDAVKKMIKADEEDDDDDNLPLSILACKNKRKESPPMSTETPELHSKKKPPPKKQRLSVDDVKTEGEESVDVEDIPSLPPTPTEKYKTPAKNHKMWGSKKSKMTINVDSYASDIEVEALKDSSAEVVSSKVIEGTTKTASKCDIDQEIALGDESTSSDRQVDKTQTKSPKKKKKTKVKPKQPNQQIDVKSNENTNKSQVIPTIESPDMMRPDDEATLSSCGSPVADALSSPNATPVKGQRRRSLIEKLKEIPLQLSNQVQTMDSHDPSQLQSVHTSDEKQTTVAASKKKTAKPSRPRKRKTNELPNSKVKNKNGETLPVSPMEKNSGNLINAEDSFKTPGAFETRKNLPGKRKRAMSTSRATPEGKLASPSKDCITESVVDKDIQTSKNPSESTKKRRSGNNSKEVDLHDVNELTCLDCGLGFGSVASLEDHQQDCVTIAFEMSLMQAEDHLYECPHCQVTFALKGTQRKHTTSCRMGKYKKAQNRHDGKNGKKSYKNQPTLPTHMTQPGNKSPAAPDTPSRRSMVKGRSCSKENVAGEGDVTHTSPLRDNFVQVLLSHNDKEMGVNDGRLPENIKNLDYIPKVMSVNASSTPKLKRESQVNGRPVNGELKELLSPVNVDDNRWCSVCGCEVVDKDLYNKHRLIEQFSFCCQQPVVLEVCALITQYNLGTDTIRSLVTSAVVYQDSLALSFDATLNLSSSVSSAGNNSSNGNVAKVKEVITSPHCTWIFSTLETIVKRHQTSGTVSIRGTQQEVLRAVTLLEDILKELSESDSAIEKNKMLKSMRETFEAGTRN
ncbi:hypothetical protein Pmani_014769 [Petrolisthes manimaculis]|uniref:C2H2-type domain-containing protein n=1 Tax=Petrolisthes manimaculis TaxID=1843537 RepID=A0AAE1PS92_9EUCA|nr:hypothetical protein Pmani_014769 [Petrolisthes manimaculis]